MKPNRNVLGVIGGLGSIAGADLLHKLAKATASTTPRSYDIAFEQQPFREEPIAGAEEASVNSRKLYAFDAIRNLESKHATSVLIPCFICHTFLAELQGESDVPLVSIMDALEDAVMKLQPRVTKIGVLTTSLVRNSKIFEKQFNSNGYEVFYPDHNDQEALVMSAIYGSDGLKSGNLKGNAIDLLQRAAHKLMERGAEIILPGAAEIAIVADVLKLRGIPVIDSNQAYVDYSLKHNESTVKPFKVGVIGGVGPAATVDFLGKLVRNTNAKTDQEHIKVVVEQNPQIPDRTASLNHGGADPTVALYSTCKKLEAADADLIAIPCNTAHAFVERIQPYLSIPIVNMLNETIWHIVAQYGSEKIVGLLATDGTVKSGVYHAVAEKAGVKMIVPDEPHQKMVMESIYGTFGVKAGYTTGECKDILIKALDYLVDQGAEVIILGCTELPLLLAQTENYQTRGKRVAIMDPTEILARRCVAYARSHPSMP